jgi:2'-5' RNA ligase
MQRYINLVAEKSGNAFMIKECVPPHLTVSAFETRDEESAMVVLDRIASRLKQGKLTWASVGQFFPYVIFIQPVLNSYLHQISQIVYEELEKENVNISPYYQPFQWLPHTTIGKTLSQDEIKTAFEVLQTHFGVFDGTAVRIGLASTNPHRDIKTFTLNTED